MATPFFNGRRNIKGFGFGSSFVNWLRTNIVPLVKSGGKYIGRKLLEGSSKAATDILQQGVKPGQAFKSRMREVGDEIFQTAKSRITGRGKKRKKNIKIKPVKRAKKKPTKKKPNKKKKTKLSTVF